jgi:aryl-alcohol dehydrogenase-like predicted oxidoreductase
MAAMARCDCGAANAGAHGRRGEIPSGKIVKLSLGTVQFGLDYGISNRDGRCSPGEVADIMTAAEDAGIDLLDTAPAYGDSETVIGSSISPNSRCRIVTKTPAFDHSAGGVVNSAMLRDTFERSLQRLRRDRLYGLLFHDCNDLLAADGDHLAAAMEDLKQRGLVEKIGVSIYDGTQIDNVLNRFPIDLIQVPINVLDQRLVTGGHLRRLQEQNVEIHGRSIFLQGLLLMNPAELPQHFFAIQPLLRRYRNETMAAGLTPIEAALAFAHHVIELDHLIIGVASRRELEGVLHAWSRTPDHDVDFSSFALADEAIVNPARWPAAD